MPSRFALLAFVSLLWLASCEQALSFNYSFRSDGNGDERDLAMSADLSTNDDFSDMSVADLPVVVDDFMSIDLTARSADLFVSSHDLSTRDTLAPVDLRGLDLATDLGPALSPLGGPCTAQGDCANGAGCFTTVNVNGSPYQLTNGYCSFTCDVTGTDVLCIAYSGHCRSLGGADNTLCVRDCDALCAARSGNYACCTQMTTVTQAVGCLPKALNGVGTLTCGN